jgi:hypothetical protein
VTLQRESIDTATKGRAEEGHKKGRETRPFRALDGFDKIRLSLLE